MPQQSNTMGISTLKAGLGNSNQGFQRNYLWEVKLPTMIGTTNVGDTSSIEKLINHVQFGNYAFAVNKLVVGPYSSGQIGLLAVPMFFMKFLVPSPNILEDYLSVWKNLMVSKDGLFSVKSQYQASIYCHFISTNGQLTGQYKMTGCFPTQFPYYVSSYSNGKVTEVQVTFNCDKVEYTDLS
jgi:hypothetical protein